MAVKIRTGFHWNLDCGLSSYQNRLRWMVGNPCAKTDNMPYAMEIYSIQPAILERGPCNAGPDWEWI